MKFDCFSDLETYAACHGYSSIARLEKRPTWELLAMKKALSFHAWSNTTEEKLRLAAAKLILKERKGKK